MFLVLFEHSSTYLNPADQPRHPSNMCALSPCWSIGAHLPRRVQGLPKERFHRQGAHQVRPHPHLPFISAHPLHSGGESSVPHRTPAELVREKKLRDDPMAEVHGPLFVTCKRCGNRIKLSPKSSYDPFHWMKHRERCLRKPVGQARPSRRAPKEAVSDLSAPS